MVQTAMLLFASALVAAVIGFLDVFTIVVFTSVCEAARIAFFVAVLALMVVVVIGISKNPPP